MAEVKFFKNILEDSFDTLTIELGRTVESIVREYGNDDDISTTLVECYNIETGETTFEPLTEDYDFAVIASVNGVEVDINYELKEDDVCVIIVTPMAGMQSGQTEDGKWNWWGAVIGLVVGAVLGVATGGAGFMMEAAAFSWKIAGIGAAIGGIVGFVAGGIMVAGMFKDKKTDNEKGNNLPDIAGSANQPITNNVIPQVIGRMEVSPYVLGSPFTEYTGPGGKDPWITILYCVGYAPLRLSKVKFDGLVVTENVDFEGREVYAGKLSGSEVDGGDIKVKYNANNIEFEIIQQNPQNNEIYTGDLYPVARKMKRIDATPMYIKDKMISDVEAETSFINNLVQYHGCQYDDGFRTNSIRFSETFSKKLSLVLDFPDGIYRQRSHNEEGTTQRESIPLWVAVQWRPYSEVATKRTEQSTSIYERDNPNGYYGFNKENAEDGWITFDRIKIDDNEYIEPSTYGLDERNNDLANHYGNSISHSELIYDSPMSNSDVISCLSRAREITGSKGKVGYEPAMKLTISGTSTLGIPVGHFENGYETYYYTVNTEYQKFYLINSQWPGCPFSWDDWNSLPWDEERQCRYIYITNWPLLNGRYIYYGNEGWENGKAFNLQKAQDYMTNVTGKFNMSEFRVTVEADLEKFCIDNDIKPSEFLYSDDNTTRSIEVRVIRVSPNYIDQVNGSKKYGPWGFHDTLKWVSMTCDTIDTEPVDGLTDEQVIDLMRNEKPIPSRKYKDTCLLSMKCKVDSAGNISNSLEKLSVIAQSFQPVWSEERRVWLPEDIHTEKVYYDENGVRLLDDETSSAKEKFEQKRLHGLKATVAKGGNNYLSRICEEIFGAVVNPSEPDEDKRITNLTSGADGKVYITESSKKYLEYGDKYNTSAASGFVMCCLGKHLGIDSLGYDRIHQLSLGEWFMDCQDVDDGKNHVFMAANGYMYQTAKLEDWLSKICTAGRAGFTMDSNGKLVVVMDKIVPYPVGIFNNQNALSTTISYDFKPAPSGLMVKYKNEANFNIDEALPVMMDGEDYKNPRGDIEAFSLDFVTNITQAYSLGRYAEAVRLFGKKSLSWKSGIEGFDIQFGDVIKVSSDMLLIGQACGRIVEFIEDEWYIYGIILSDSYEYDGKPGHAIEIMQPEQYAEDKVIVVSVNEGEGLVKEDGTFVPCQSVGMTNVVVFARPMVKSGKREIEKESFYFSPQIGNLVNYGFKENVSKLFRVKSKTPEANFTFGFSLVPYDDKFYTYGAKMPIMNRNITVPSRTTDLEVPVNYNATLSDLNKAVTQTREDLSIVINESIDNIGSLPPSVPVVTASFVEAGIKVSAIQPSNGLNEIVKEYQYQLCKNYTSSEDDPWEDVTVRDGVIYFNRETDGYPEIEDLLAWAIRVRCVNQCDVIGTWTSGKKPSTSEYGTWQVYPPEVKTYNSGRNITMFFSQKELGLKQFGNIRYEISIKRTDGIPDTVWYKPGFNDPYESEDNYKTVEGYTVFSETFQHTVPLLGQDGENPNPELTRYEYRIIGINESTDTIPSNKSPEKIIPFVATPVSVKDITDSLITSNKLAEGCVTFDKLDADVLSAESVATRGLVSEKAVIGTLAGSEIERDNFWNLQTGEFRISSGKDAQGDEDFFHVKPSEGITMKIKNFVMTAISSIIRGLFYVKSANEENSESFFVVNPTMEDDSVTGTLKRSARVRGCLNIEKFDSENYFKNAFNLPEYIEVIFEK